MLKGRQSVKEDLKKIVNLEFTYLILKVAARNIPLAEKLLES